jgi:uncharacterized protein YndB with AHSA1/START domain
MTMKLRVAHLVLAGAALCAPLTTAGAEVTDRSPNGFTIKVVADIDAGPEAVWTALVRNVGAWWDSEHTYTGVAKNLSIEARPGGGFCETLPNGGFVEHGAVVNAQPGSLLRLRGALGPLQEGGVAGSFTWQLETAGTGTRLTFTHAAGGYFAGGLDKLADIVDKVLADQVRRLEEYVEKPR